jgi:SAM-dependent methyltransferase
MTETRQSSEFDADQVSQAYPEGIENDWWSTARAWTVEAALPDKGRILEIGCGRGVVVNYLLSKGRDVWGSELASPPLLSGLADRIFAGVSAESLPAAFRNSVTCLLLLDVIEHIDNAPAFLTKILAAYPNAATVIVTVPARPEVWSAWDDHYEHRRRYTRKSLSAHLTDAGLQPSKPRYFFPFALYRGIAAAHDRPQAQNLPLYARQYQVASIAGVLFLARNQDADARRSIARAVVARSFAAERQSFAPQ